MMVDETRGGRVETAFFFFFGGVRRGGGRSRGGGARKKEDGEEEEEGSTRLKAEWYGMTVETRGGEAEGFFFCVYIFLIF